jgi:hypothetical protein
VADQYRCRSERRRESTRKSSLNGIDYLEVLDHDAPAGIEPQRTLIVRCLKPVALATANVVVEGGVRITPVRVLWAAPASSVPAPAEQAFFQALPEADHVLVVRTDSSGDSSTYLLRLVQAEGDASFDFDPQLTEVEFSFKAECPSEFDCRPADECEPARGPEPTIDYLAKDYASFRRLLLDRLSMLMPDWRERHAADEEIALVELLAYSADYLSYYQDAVATEAYLGTARRRVSVRRHVRLLDYAMHDGCNARAWVAFDVTAPADGLTLPARTELLTQVGLPRGALDPAKRDEALRRGAKVFETLHPATLHAARNSISFHTWGDEECCLPKGATRATLRYDGPSLDAGDVLVFEERLGPASGLRVDADPAHRHAVRLTGASPAVDPLDGTAVVHVTWDVADELPFPLCLSVIVSTEAGDKFVEDASVAVGNVVLADHGRAVVDELEPATVPTRAPYRPRLSQSGLTFHVPYDHQRAETEPASRATTQAPRAAVPWLELAEDGKTWTARSDLLGSDRFARDFVVELERGDVGTLRFGDGVFGRRPEPGRKLVPSYRVGNGREGSVGAEAISHVLHSNAGIANVRNPLPAAGGTEPETIEEARLYAPHAFRTQQRAVTEADYAAATERFPGVQRAVATRRWTGSWQTIFVTVDRLGGRAVDSAFEVALRAHLERFRLAGYDLEIDGPRPVPLDVAFTVCVAAGYLRSDVKQELLRVLGARELADGGRGFFHPDNFSFGQPVYLSRLTAAAMSVAGVEAVDFDDAPPKQNRFKRYGETAHGELAAGRIALGRLEVARLDNDPNAPENGKLELFLAGGL